MSNNGSDYKNVYTLESKLLDTLEKLNLTERDVLLIKAPVDARQYLMDFAKHIRETINRKYALSDMLILFVTDDTDIAKLDEEKMKEYGWFKEKGKPNNNSEVTYL